MTRAPCVPEWKVILTHAAHQLGLKSTLMSTTFYRRRTHKNVTTNLDPYLPVMLTDTTSLATNRNFSYHLGTDPGRTCSSCSKVN